MFCHFKRHFSQEKCLKSLYETPVDAAPARVTAFRWVAEFKRGRESSVLNEPYTEKPPITVLPDTGTDFVSIRVNKIEESSCASLFHISNIWCPMLGAKCCLVKGQQDRGILLCFFVSYIKYLGPHVGCQMLSR